MHTTQHYAHRVTVLADTTIRDTLALAAQPGIISLGGGIPAAELFPLDAVRSVFAQLTDVQLQIGLQYSNTQGLLGLRTQIAQHLTANWGRQVSPEQVLITTGSQQALDLVAKTFLETGDVVAIENPSYLAAISAFQTNAPKFFPIPIGETGPDIDVLKTILQKQKPKLFYAIPTFQNPTGCVWSETTRKQVLDSITHSDCLIIEDDPYGELYFTKKPPQPLAASSANVLYLGTFSKTLFPGLRVGYIVSTPPIISTMTLIKQSMDLHSPSLSQVLLEQLLADSPWYQNHLANLRAHYKQQRQHMVAALRTHLPASVRWQVPTGGLFVWLKIPGVDSRALLKRAVAEGVAFMPGYPFYARQPDYETIRLTFATANETQIHQAVKKLCTTLLSCK